MKEWNLAGFEDRLAELIRKGRAVIFLDGLDEVVTNAATRQRVIGMIKALPDVIGAGSIMVTCRVLSDERDYKKKYCPRCGAARGSSSVTEPGVRTATGATRTIGATASVFVASGLKLSFFPFTLLAFPGRKSRCYGRQTSSSKNCAT